MTLTQLVTVFRVMEALRLSTRRRLFHQLLMLGLLALGAGSTAATEDQQRAELLLERMSTAIGSLDYEGTLVYLFDNRLESLHLVHRMNGGAVQERLLSLSGPVRALTRERGRVTCVMPDGHPISVKSHVGRNLLRSEPIDLAALAGHYGVALDGMARVAGRDTDVITLQPRDPLRYGYRFHLDRETGLPLKSDLIDHLGQPVEQLMFTTISFHGVEKGLNNHAEDGSDKDVIGPAGAVSRVDASPESAIASRSHWRFDGRPAGFEQAMHGNMGGTSGNRVEHFVFTDGLSAYSVYIETDTEDGLDGVTRLGAVHAAGRELDGHQVTAVGEVPAATVEAAVAGVSRMSEDQR